jgi:RNA polymerase sigma-70 factor (ECF subfamily)
MISPRVFPPSRHIGSLRFVRKVDGARRADVTDVAAVTQGRKQGDSAMSDVLADRFERSRPRLRSVAYRMLGSAPEADDAVQEAWLRLDRTGPDGIDNLDAWLVTVVGRVCLDMLRSRTARREASLDATVTEPAAATDAGPEQEAELADSVGLALLVVLEALTPAERLAFVLHDMFGVSFDEVAPIVGRSPEAARQLASRARRRVRAQPSSSPSRSPSSRSPVGASREIVDAFLRAARGGEVETLLTLLDPDIRMRINGAAADQPGGAPTVARFFAGKAHSARPALIDGALGIAVVIGGEVRILLRLTVADGRITEMDSVLDPAAVASHEVSLL